MIFRLVRTTGCIFRLVIQCGPKHLSHFKCSGILTNRWLIKKQTEDLERSDKKWHKNVCQNFFPYYFEYFRAILRQIFIFILVIREPVKLDERGSLRKSKRFRPKSRQFPWKSSRFLQNSTIFVETELISAQINLVFAGNRPHWASLRSIITKNENQKFS